MTHEPLLRVKRDAYTFTHLSRLQSSTKGGFGATVIGQAASDADGVVGGSALRARRFSMSFFGTSAKNTP